MDGDAPIFATRFGLQKGALIQAAFPTPARIALEHLLAALAKRKFVSLDDVCAEVARLLRADVDSVTRDSLSEAIHCLEWSLVFVLCERVHSRLLHEVTDWSGWNNEVAVVATIDDARTFFTKEVNQLLREESFAYEFLDGLFVRPGRPVTRRLTAKTGAVLTAPELRGAAALYKKALEFFGRAPEGDYPNVVKEAVSALEAAAKALFPELKSRDLQGVIKALGGTGANDIAPTLVKAILAVYEYRGAAEDVAHGGATGGTVTAEVAELVLNMCSIWITFLHDLRRRRTDVPAFF